MRTSNRPEYDKPIDEIAEALEKIRRNPVQIFGFTILAVIVIAVWSSFYTVQPDEQAVVARFGRYLRTDPPGLSFKLPFGIDRVVKISTKTEQEDFGFRPSASRSSQRSDGPAPSEESSMLTGDLKVADVRWSVQYRINDPRKFLYSVSNQPKVIRDISRAAMRQVVGDRSVYEVLTVGREKIGQESGQLAQRIFDTYDLGIDVIAINMQSVSPPEPVSPSFSDVNASLQDKDQAINRAQSEYNRVIPEARGIAEQEALRAQGYALQTTNTARGDAERLKKIIAEYEKAPEVTRTRMYLEMIEKILSRSHSLTIIDPSLKGVLPIFGAEGKQQNVAALRGALDSTQDAEHQK
jgi:modulator of FtsH protease HflK